MRCCLPNGLITTTGSAVGRGVEVAEDGFVVVRETVQRNVVGSDPSDHVDQHTESDVLNGSDVPEIQVHDATRRGPQDFTLCAMSRSAVELAVEGDRHFRLCEPGAGFGHLCGH